LTDVKGMSGDGKVIAGNGAHNGVTQAWVVLLGVPGQPPSITQHPVARTICPGAGTTFTVSAAGLGALGYQWQKNGANLSDGGHYSGTTTATLTVTSADADDAADYGCVVSAGCSTVTSNSASLALKTATQITQQPTPQSVLPDSNVQFIVSAEGDGTILYRWQKNGIDLSDGGKYSGATTATLSVSIVGGGEVGDYRCVVTAGCGTVSSHDAALTLIVIVPPDLDQDGDVDVDDWDLFEACASGPGITHAGGTICDTADFDADGDIDQADFGIFQRCLSGAGVPADANCGN
jgi:hypothetical protein